ncbi:glycosyltransferase [Ornithinimicrobium sp. F0845]|uniref:glycosyltransferase n=1 Tax=Ornithinimicrobium sp. F0845 TaxID=2926412 RepID=UPI001FF67862|nr:glycosyltransferase [Ornithinimicrobium sp. F0845]MCK0112130.1 glycosyltransferase [Ornithinimicrobium sp. F0845]
MGVLDRPDPLSTDTSQDQPGADLDQDLVVQLAEQLRPESVGHYTQFAIRTRSPLAPRVLSAAGERAALARFTALSGAPDAHVAGLEQLDRVVAREGLAAQSPDVATLYAQLLVRADRDEELEALLADEQVALSDLDRWSLRTDLLNPHRVSPHRAGLVEGLTAEELAAAEDRWLAVFNEIHAADGLEPVQLRPLHAGANPYQRLSAPVAGQVDEGPRRVDEEPRQVAGAVPAGQVDGELVTVVMSAFRPDRDLLLAVRGVLEQTWRNLELLVVDDASPAGFESLLEEAEALDPRVRVVRAPRNGGTYEARNLALSLAQGRWMTFQDSDDWTHPRRVEVQVRHLLENPDVLANRTWTLRAYQDLTLTYVGYPAARLNASSLLFDRVPVQQLVGHFDAVRKSGDMELPFRLRALRKGSVRDLRHPAPMAITQLRSNSLSRADAIPGWLRWDRLAYRDSYMEWHDQVSSRRHRAVLPGDGRPFPVPRRAWAPDPPGAVTAPGWQVVVLGDLRNGQPRAPRTLGVARAAADAGLSVAVAHAESPLPLATKRESLTKSLSRDVRLGRAGLTNPHEQDHVDLLVVTEPASLLHLDDAHLQVAEILVVADEATPEGWTVEAVDRRCQDLFDRLPQWGGPARVHRGEEPSAVRAAVPDERWVDADLAPVSGADWPQTGPARPARRELTGQRPLVIGHHLRDYVSRWPRGPKTLRHAYPEHIWPLSPEEIPTDVTQPLPVPPAGAPVLEVEVHALSGLTVPTAVLGRDLPPPSWCSFLGTGMTAREFLSHLDVWVYHGRWDLHAEIAALEALAAGLPCVLPAEAAESRLEGRVRCVDPWLTSSALLELLEEPDAARQTEAPPAHSAPQTESPAPSARATKTPPAHSARQRQDTWAATLTDLLPTRELSADAPAGLVRAAATDAFRAGDHARTAELLTALLGRREARFTDVIRLSRTARRLGDADLLDRAQAALLSRTPRSPGQLRRAVAALEGLRPAHLDALQQWRTRLADQAPPLNLTGVDALVLDVRVTQVLEGGLEDEAVAALLEVPDGPRRLVRRMTRARQFDDLETQLPTWPAEALDRVPAMAWHWLARHAATHGWTGLAALAAAREEGDAPTESTRELTAEAEDERTLLAQPWEPPARAPDPDPAELDRRSVVSVLGQSLPLRSGGYATRSHGILTSLSERGWDVTAVTRLGFPFDLWWSADDEREPAPVDVVDGVPYHRLLTEGVRDYPRVPLPPYVARGAEGIAALARAERASLVHASSLYDVGMAGLTAARTLGVPFVYEMRGLKQLLEEARFPLFSGSPRRRYLDQLEGTVARHADALLVITEALGREMVRMGVDPERITVVPNGVDASRFTPRERDEELAERLGLSGRTIIGYLGGLVHYEGLDLLCEAIARMRGRRDDFHVLVVGDGAFEKKLHLIVEELGVGDLITFTGRVPHEEVEGYLSLVDITPFPRKPLPVCEMISPIKPFESMAMRKTVVASDVAALTEIVQDGVTGRLFTKGDADDLARVLEELLDDPEERARLGAAAREWVVAERDWRRITDAVDGVYRRLLG